jgi:DMSO/TMAO reductase YedYZ molybdopterin-dependent catalytic subunit
MSDELPVNELPPDEPALNDPPMVEPPVDEPPLADPPVAEPPVDEPPPGEPQTHALPDDDRELRRLTRRGFVTMGVAAGAGVATWTWLRSRPPVDGLQWPFRRVLETNESLARGYFSTARLSPQFRRSDVTRARLNGQLGLNTPVDLDAWRLRIEGAAGPLLLTMDDIRGLPVQEMITELRCIEGWSIIVQWKGARLADLMARFPPLHRSEYVALETPGRGYYVGLDFASAMHPQTLLAYEMNGQPLPQAHGAPLRLAIPVKYGIKNIKRIGTIRYTNVRPADFWAERGYDWYAGH